MSDLVYPACAHRPHTDREQRTPCEECQDPVAPPPPGPAPLMVGTFGIYDDGDGGFWLMARIDGRPGVERKHIPAKLVKLATTGPFARLAGGLFGA